MAARHSQVIDKQRLRLISRDFEKVMDRVRHEVLLCQTVRHRHIVAVHDVLEDQRRVYIVMELMEGDLFDAIVARGSLSEREVCGRLG